MLGASPTLVEPPGPPGPPGPVGPAGTVGPAGAPAAGSKPPGVAIVPPCDAAAPRRRRPLYAVAGGPPDGRGLARGRHARQRLVEAGRVVRRDEQHRLRVLAQRVAPAAPGEHAEAAALHGRRVVPSEGGQRRLQEL